MTELDDRELDWSAWEVDDLPESFADDVLDAIDAGGPVQDEVEVVAPAVVELGERRRRWSIAVGAGLAAAAATVLWFASRSTSPDQSDATQLARFDGVGVTTEDDSAAWRWLSTSDRSAIAEQTAGRVRWDAQRGVPLTVQTPAGRVSTTDADFSLEVVDMSPRKTAILAGTVATGAVAALVYLHSGEAELDNDEGAMKATAPQRAVMTDQSAPQLMADAAVTPKVAHKTAVDDQGALKWKAAKAGIEQAIARRGTTASIAGSGGGSAPEHDDESKQLGTLSKEYIRDTVAEDVVPLVRECYNNLLEDHPEIGGKMVLQFAIMGDESVGGIVDEMTFADDSEIHDDEFRECVGESMMSTVFPAPEGGGRVEVVYPIIFEPDKRPAR